jgi:hypothetical protein
VRGAATKRDPGKSPGALTGRSGGDPVNSARPSGSQSGRHTPNRKIGGRRAQLKPNFRRVRGPFTRKTEGHLSSSREAPTRGAQRHREGAHKQSAASAVGGLEASAASAQSEQGRRPPAGCGGAASPHHGVGASAACGRSAAALDRWKGFGKARRSEGTDPSTGSFPATHPKQRQRAPRAG